MIPAKHFYMIRHGETEANAAKIMAGSLDSPLTETGRQQADKARILIEKLEIKPQVIVHSDLSRARETAEIINTKLDLPMIEEPDLAEMHAGDWEGVHYDQCQPLLDGWVNAPNGEKYIDFFQRIKTGKRRVLDAHSAPVLIVSHGGVFRAFGELYNVRSPARFRNCQLHEFIPAPEYQEFPWQVWEYHCEQTLRRSRTPLFHGEDAKAMA